jgi:beta-lactamase class A
MVMIDMNLMSKSQSLIGTLIFTVCISSTNASPLEDKVNMLQQKGWKVGVSIFDSNSKKIESVNGDTRFPLDSTVKALACANVLSNVDKGLLSLENKVLIEEKDVVSHSPITMKLINKSITLRDACAATTAYSDNTAANIAISSVGGPLKLTQFMRELGDTKTRSDRYEPELVINPEFDLRDTTTTDAMSESLSKLLVGNTLSKKSREQLKSWMMDNKVADNMLRARLPEGWSIADRSGASDYGIRGITSMVWSKTQQPLFISIYVRKSNTTLDERSRVINEIGEVIFNRYN